MAVEAVATGKNGEGVKVYACRVSTGRSARMGRIAEDGVELLQGFLVKIPGRPEHAGVSC